MFFKKGSKDFDSKNPAVAKTFHRVVNEILKQGSRASEKGLAEPQIRQSLENSYVQTLAAATSDDGADVFAKIIAQSIDNAENALRNWRRNSATDEATQEAEVFAGMMFSAGIHRQIIFAWAPALARADSKSVTEVTKLISSELTLGVSRTIGGEYSKGFTAFHSLIFPEPS